MKLPCKITNAEVCATVEITGEGIEYARARLKAQRRRDIKAVLLCALNEKPLKTKEIQEILLVTLGELL